MSNGTNPKTPSIRQLASLAGFIVECLAQFLNFEQVQYWLKNRAELKKKLREVFSITDEYADIRKEWEMFYKDNFGWDVDLSMIIIPVKPNIGNWRLVFIAKGMTINRAFAGASKLFKAWRYAEDLDSVITKNIRTASESYTVWVRDGVEPDAEYLGKSTKVADLDLTIGITVLERIILEMKYFLETGKHLDVKGVTFCSGSRGSRGTVPGCNWFEGNFRVLWHGLNNTTIYYGIRRVISS